MKIVRIENGWSVMSSDSTTGTKKQFAFEDKEGADEDGFKDQRESLGRALTFVAHCLLTSVRPVGVDVEVLIAVRRE